MGCQNLLHNAPHDARRPTHRAVTHTRGPAPGRVLDAPRAAGTQHPETVYKVDAVATYSPGCCWRYMPQTSEPQAVTVQRSPTSRSPADSTASAAPADVRAGAPPLRISCPTEQGAQRHVTSLAAGDKMVYSSGDKPKQRLLYPYGCLEMAQTHVCHRSRIASQRGKTHVDVAASQEPPALRRC